MNMKFLAILVGGLVVCIAVGVLLLAIMALSARLMRWRFGDIPPDVPEAEYGSHQKGFYQPVPQQANPVARFLRFALSTVMVPVFFTVVPLGLILLVVLLVKPQWLMR